MDTDNLRLLKHKYLRRVRILAIELWLVTGLLIFALTLASIDVGWATALFWWSRFAVPLVIVTQVIIRNTTVAFSLRALSGLAVIWMLMGSVAYMMQYDPLHWLVRLAEAPLTSFRYISLTVLEWVTLIAEFVFGTTLCVLMIRRIMLSIAYDRVA